MVSASNDPPEVVVFGCRAIVFAPRGQRLTRKHSPRLRCGVLTGPSVNLAICLVFNSARTEARSLIVVTDNSLPSSVLEKCGSDSEIPFRLRCQGIKWKISCERILSGTTAARQKFSCPSLSPPPAVMRIKTTQRRHFRFHSHFAYAMFQNSQVGQNWN